jgi:hypothetical protein
MGWTAPRKEATLSTMRSSSRPRLLLAAALLALGGARAGTARAEPDALPAPPAVRTVAVLPLLLGASEEVSTTLVFRAVERAAELRPEVRAMSLDDFFFHDGKELAERALACGEDTACIAEQLKPFRAELGLVVIINRELSPAMLSALLLDAGSGVVVADAFAQLDARPDEIAAAVSREVGGLFERLGLRQSGRLEVRVAPPGARLEVQDARGEKRAPERGHLELFTLPPGDYVVTASLEGHRDASLRARIASGAATRLDLTLEEAPGLMRSPWFWLGAAAVAIGAGVALGAAVASGEASSFCVGTRGEYTCTAGR